MRGAKGIVDVQVGEGRVALGQLGIVLGLSRFVADVLEHHHFNVGQLVEAGHERDVDSEQLAQALGSRLQGQLRLAVLRPPEMSGQDQLARATGPQLLERRERGADADVVGDATALVQRDVEVHADEHALAFGIEVVKRTHTPAPAERARRALETFDAHSAGTLKNLSRSV